MQIIIPTAAPFMPAKLPQRHSRSSSQKHLETLPYPLGQLSLSKFPSIEEALLREIEVLHRCHVLGWWFADTRRDHHGIRLEDDAVVYELVDGE